MKRVILTSSSGVGLTYAGRADMVVVPLIFRQKCPCITYQFEMRSCHI